MSLNKPVWKLRDWIDEEKIDWYNLSLNSNAIDLLLKNRDKINWNNFSLNPNGVDILLENFDKIDLRKFAQNDNLPEVFDNIKNKLNWLDYTITLSKNKNSQKIFNKHRNYFKINGLMSCFYEEVINNTRYNSSLTKDINELLEFENEINWKGFSANPKAIDYLIKNPDKIDWDNLSLNPNGIELLLKNPDKINWINLNLNESEEAIEVLEKNPDKINWTLLSSNQFAIKLLEKNRDKIDYYSLWKNPAIFELDYKKMKNNNQEMYEELMMKIMEPSRIIKKIEEYGYNYIELFR